MQFIATSMCALPFRLIKKDFVSQGNEKSVILISVVSGKKQNGGWEILTKLILAMAPLLGT